MLGSSVPALCHAPEAIKASLAVLEKAMMSEPGIAKATSSTPE
jgi:hypothetical protein